jgi:transcriptional regulator with XRE-family HTH domain
MNQATFFSALLQRCIFLLQFRVVCSIYYTLRNALGKYLRERRLEKQQSKGNAFSLRQLAGRVGVEPSYLSKIERGLEPRPSTELTQALASELGEDSDVLLAMAGKVSGDLLEIIRKRPKLFAQLLRELKNAPDHALLRVVREVRDGNW